MKILAISGSARKLSTNTVLLRGLQAAAPNGVTVDIYDRIGDLPVFSPDREGDQTPAEVHDLISRITAADGLIISSPEYVRGIPGGMKNAIDWLVSGDAIVGKPIVLAHASHRGDDMLAALRQVLATVSSGFNSDLFFRLPVMKETPEAILELLHEPANRSAAQQFLHSFTDFAAGRTGLSEASYRL